MGGCGVGEVRRRGRRGEEGGLHAVLTHFTNMFINPNPDMVVSLERIRCGVGGTIAGKNKL